MIEVPELDTALIEGYLDELRLLYGRSSNTVDAYYRDLRKVNEMLVIQGKGFLGAQDCDVRELLLKLKSEMADSSIARLMSVLRNFYRWLVDSGSLDSSPVGDIEVPKIPYLLPEVISTEEVERLIAAIDVRSATGMRDRVIVELLYGSGLRVSEATSLDLNDLVDSQGIIRVIGKGQKTRLVPLTGICESVLSNYIFDGYRSTLQGDKRTAAVFLSTRGTRLSRQAIWQMVRNYALNAGIRTAIHPHTLRHSCATHMVNGGADIRVVQELLGHSSLATTQIYTHVNPERLQSVYRKCHPRAEINGETYL